MTNITEPIRVLDEQPAKPGRRGFLTSAAAGFTLAFVIPDLSRMSEALGAPITQVTAWLTIGADDSITFAIGASEMGQGSFTGLAQIMAEELMVDYARIRTVQGAPSLAAVTPVGASLNTVGSGITRNNFWKTRDAGAIAREMLVTAAMNINGDGARGNYSVTNGVVKHTPSGKTYTYGSLADAASKLAPPASAPLVPDAQFKVIGKTVPRQDIPAKTDGSAQYGIDVRVPGMFYAVVKHCPSFGGTLSGTPATPSGMKAVVPLKVIAGTGRGTEITGNVNAVAVVGSNTWDAWQAVRSLRVSWTLPAGTGNLNSTKFLADAQALAVSAPAYVAGGANPPGTCYTVEGAAAPVTAALATSAKVVDATYTLPYVAHACMEVLNCTVDYKANTSCEIWAPTQSGKGVLQLAMLVTGLQASQITVHTTYLGGGLGRKAEHDFVSQAIQVSMAINAPVKLMWPRDQDFTRDQYRPMGLVHAKAGLDSAGQINAWSYRNVSPSILGQRGAVLSATGDSQGSEASNKLPYNFGSRLVEWVSHPSPIPVGFWRSVGASINTFAVESMIDELAVAAGQDPYIFRKTRLSDPRWVAVLDAVANLANWNTAPKAGRARGIAIGTAFNSIVAEVVEISNVTATSMTVNNVWLAIDCYLTVNPGQIEAQMQGGIVHGLNAALFGQQTFVNGVGQASNFNKSRMIRLREMPQVAITIIPSPTVADRTVNIGGAGELGVPTLAPALANAYFKLTGKRQRSLPFFPGATMSDL